jgi:hypothetical protein
MTPAPAISVVVATRHGGPAVTDSLRCLSEQAGPMAAEIILVDATGGAIASQMSAGVRHIVADVGLLVPELWSVGVRAASAPIVALTIGQCVPTDGWLSSILRTAAEHGSAAGFGGSVDAPHAGRARDWGMYFSRYSAYMPPLTDGPIAELAGDNAAYRLEALRLSPSAFSGFWENLVHEELRAQGRTLRLAGGMRVQFGSCPGVRAFCRERYQHGRYFGATRPGLTPSGRALRALTAPALAPFLLARIGMRVVRLRRDWLPQFVRALPWLAAFIASWSAGEAAGYLRPRTVRP